MKKNIIIGIVAVFALALAISTAMAFGPGYGRSMRNGRPPVSNLTPEQTAKIQAIQEANLKNITPLRDELFAKRTELRDLWRFQSPDQTQIKALQQDIQGRNTQLQEKATNARLEMSKILTLEQQAQLTAYGTGAGHGMGRMGGRIGRR